MAIVVVCPGCKVRLTLGDDRAGTTLPCPKCGTIISVPAPPAPPPPPVPPSDPQARAGQPPSEPAGAPASGPKLRFKCPACHKVYKANSADAGKKMLCKRCGAVLLIPDAPVSESTHGIPSPMVGDGEAEEAQDLSGGEESAVEEPPPVLNPVPPSSPPPLPAEEPPADERDTAEPDAPDDDYIPPRRRKRRSVSSTGLLLVGGLSVVLLISLVGLAWKTNKVRESAKGAEKRTEDRARSTPSTSDSKFDDPHRTTHEQADVGEGMLGAVCWGVGVIGVVAIVWLICSCVNVCPRCRRWKAVRCVQRRVVERKRCYGIVTRRGQSTSHGVIFTNNGTTPTTSTQSSEWEERVPVIRTTFKCKMKCRFCHAKWFEEEVEEVEDFERG